MKKLLKAQVSALRAANPDSKPRQHAYTGSGQWLYWHTPSGERIPVGVAITIGKTTYRQLADPLDIEATAIAIWGESAAWQLGKLLEATAYALHASQPLPIGISSEAIPFCHGDSPAQILDRLWRHGPAKSILLKKKPPRLTERHSGDLPHVTTPDAPAAHSPDEGVAQQPAPAKAGAKRLE